MVSRRFYKLVQRILNQVNQTKNATNDWFRGEALYNKVCLETVYRRLEGNDAPVAILDGGCGTGLMSIDMAKKGHSVTGIEIHKPSLELLQENARKAGVSVETIQGDLLDRLREMPPAHFDAALCMGVLYTCAEYRSIVGEFGRSLKSGGLFFATFRPPFYFVSALLRRGQFDKAVAVTKTSEGMLRLAQTPAYYNWQTHAEIKQLFDQNQLDVLELRPTGIYSGAGYDGMASLVDVETISAEQLSSLLELELNPGDVSGSGRFTLAVGRKR